MAEEFLNINPPENFPRKETGPGFEPPKENRLLAWLKGLLTFLVLLLVVVGSFWISFRLGKSILMPVKKTPERKIEVAIPEAPASIKALQRLQEAMSAEARKKEKAKAKVAAKVVRPRRKMVYRAKPAAAHHYKVQAGWFADKGNADELASKLKASGFEVYQKKVSGGWRVQAGAYKTKSTAEALRKKLKDKGFDSSLIYE
jgi:cell division protein FtsN